MNLLNLTTARASFVPGAATAGTTLVFELAVTDNEGATSLIRVNVYVNRPPIASAVGNDNPACAGIGFSLDGSASRDPDGRIVSFRWQQIAGAPADGFTTPTAPRRPASPA